MRPGASRRGFSLVELAIVVAIMGVIAAIAVPRVSRAVEDSRINAKITDIVTVQKAIDLYMVEHGGLSPAHNSDGSTISSSAVFWQRLSEKSNEDGTVNASGLYGPYLRTHPTNSSNGLDTVRIDGMAAGANTHGWHFDTTETLFLPDDSAESVSIAKDVLKQAASL